MRPFRSVGGDLEVDCYSGYKGDERPVRFRIGGAVFPIDAILDHWRTPDDDCFQIRAAGGISILRHHLDPDTWSIEPRPAPRATQRISHETRPVRRPRRALRLRAGPGRRKAPGHPDR